MQAASADNSVKAWERKADYNVWLFVGGISRVRIGDLRYEIW